MHNKILHAQDGSEGAFRALTEAIELARLCGADLHMISVEEIPHYAGRTRQRRGCWTRPPGSATAICCTPPGSCMR